ncbi:MAG: enoyl-CoA hydratase/isomerase family protein [Janthinobacterium lividum]
MTIDYPPFEALLCERRGHALWLTLNRPDAMNSMSPTLVAEIGQALDLMADDRQVRCLVITGSGRAFCAGADLKAVKSLSGETDPVVATKAFLSAATQLLSRIERLPLPVIAAVNGIALAGGLETVLVSDLVIAAEEAKFGDAHAKYGLLPGWGGSVRLPRKIGPNRAKQLIFTADHVPARTMFDWGLVNEVVPRARLVEAVDAWVARLVDKSPLGLRRMKQLVDDGLEQSPETALRNEQLMVELHNQSHDRREGLAAFAEKRAPAFNGT